jgi:hypothetical protein
MSELNRLRCRLRVLNIEYSALVRRKAGETSYARMAALRTERRALMALIAVERHTATMEWSLELMRMWPTSTRVNKPDHDDQAILEPLQETEPSLL